MKKYVIAILLIFVAVFCSAQSISYVPAMKPYLGEWVCEKGSVTMTLVIEKVGNTVTAKYKAVNYEDARPRTFYTDYETIQWRNGVFIFSYKSDAADKDLLIKEIVSLKGKNITITLQCWERTQNGYVLRHEQEIGKFHISW